MDYNEMVTNPQKPQWGKDMTFKFKKFILKIEIHMIIIIDFFSVTEKFVIFFTVTEEM